MPASSALREWWDSASSFCSKITLFSRITALAASGRSAGKTYGKAVKDKWAFDCPVPEKYVSMTVFDAEKDADAIAEKVDFVFCAVNMDKAKIKALEESYAKREIPVVSNNSAHRFTPDVPMVIPEINPEHLEIISAQKSASGQRRVLSQSSPIVLCSLMFPFCTR